MEDSTADGKLCFHLSNVSAEEEQANDQPVLVVQHSGS